MDYHFWIYVGLLSCIMYVSAQSSEQYRCPHNDRRRTQRIVPFNGKCYQFVHQERYWTSARDYCRDYGGRLVTVNDAETNRFLMTTLNSLPWSNSGVWIGLHDRDRELHWQWSTESEWVDEPVRFEYWARGHPKAFLHSLRDCVRMVRKSSWKWHETPCSALKWKYRFICEYGMLPPSTTPRPPTYPSGFHEPLEQLNWGQGWARPPPPMGEEDGDVRITADDVMVASTTTQRHESKTTSKPEFYEEDSIDVIVPMQLTQNRGKDDGKGNMIFGVVGCVVALLCILAFVFVIFIRRRKRKEDANNSENLMYGATDEEVKVKGHGQPQVNPKVTERVMNIYTNPSDQLEHMTALQRLNLTTDNEEEVMMLRPSGGQCNGSDLDDENVKNQQLEDASQYLEPQVCMAHRPLPKVQVIQGQGHSEVKLQGRSEVKVNKRKPQRFVRPKSPAPLNMRVNLSVKGEFPAVSESEREENEESQMVENPYEDAEDVDENEYAEIPGDNIYETLDEMKKSLSTMGEAHA